MFKRRCVVQLLVREPANKLHSQVTLSAVMTQPGTKRKGESEQGTAAKKPATGGKAEPAPASRSASAVPAKAAPASAPQQQVLVPVPDLPSGHEEHAHDALDVIQKIYPYALRLVDFFFQGWFARA